MNIQTLQKIATDCKHPLVDKSDEDGFLYEIDGLIISETAQPVLVRGLVDRPHPSKKMWAVEVPKYYPATREEPEDVDYYEIGRHDCLPDAVKAALVWWAAHDIDQAFMAEWEAQQAIEEESKTYY